MELNKQRLKIGIVVLGLLLVSAVGAVMPGQVFITTILGGGLLSVLVFRAPVWLAACATLASWLVVLGTASGSFAIRFEIMIQVCLCMTCIGFLLGWNMRRRKSFQELMGSTIFATTLVNLALTLLGAYLSQGSISMDSIMAPYQQMYYSLEQTFVAAGNDPYEVSQMLSQMMDVMRQMLVGYLVLSSMLLVFFSFVCTRWLMRVLYKVGFPQYHFLQCFKVSTVGGIVFILVFLGLILSNQHLTVAVCSNFIIIFAPVFLLGGLSLIEWYLNRAGVRLGQKILIYLCIFGTLLLPYINLVNAAIALGVMDSIFNYRKIKEVE